MIFEKFFVIPTYLFLITSLQIFRDFGIALFVFTTFLKIILIPFSLQSYKHFRKLEKIQPRIKKIMEEHKDSAKEKEKMMKIMAVYKEEKINFYLPFIILFLQLPIMIGVFKSLQKFTQENGQLFIFRKFPALSPTPLFPLLIVVFQILNTPKTNQKFFSVFLSFLFFPAFFQLPGAISFYFLCFQFLSFVERLAFQKLKSDDR